MSNKLTRRGFLAAATVASVGCAMSGAAAAIAKPALLGGKPTRSEPFPSWPVFDEKDEQALLKVLRSGKWFRGYGQTAERFEEAYARMTGAKFCIATANGTSSLVTALAAMGVEAGDEVILPPYTFIACVNAVLLLNALPVFVDTDPQTFQIDARKIETAITQYTKAIMPVHLGGNAADLDTVLEVAKRHRLRVVEDACQAHLAEWRGRKVGTLGDTGCFSFQASKNLNCGEGGAILTSNEDLAERCYAFHTNGRNRSGGGWRPDTARAGNFRMTEFQAALLLTQMPRLESQSHTREQNAQYLTSLLRQIPGIQPARLYEGCTRNAYHLYMFRYQKERFAGLSLARFLKALDAEGIPASSGYTPLNRQPFIMNTLRSRGYQAIYSQPRIAQWEQRNACPENDRLCEEAVWLTQNILLGPQRDMDQIADAVRKIQAYAGDLARG